MLEENHTHRAGKSQKESAQRNDRRHSVYASRPPGRASTAFALSICAPAKADDDARIPLRIGGLQSTRRQTRCRSSGSSFMAVRLYVDDESDGRRKGARRVASGRVNGIHGSTARRVGGENRRRVTRRHRLCCVSLDFCADLLTRRYEQIRGKQ